MTDFGLSEETTKILKEYFSQIHEIKAVKIYGSRALGTFRKGSDIDFVLYGDIDKDLLAKINYEIDELNTPYMFDITNYAAIQNDNLKEHIDKYAKVFFINHNIL